MVTLHNANAPPLWGIPFILWRNSMIDKLGSTIHLGDEVYAINVGVAGMVVSIKEYYNKLGLKFRNFNPEGRLCVEHYNRRFQYSWVKPKNVIVLEGGESND